MTAVGVVAVGPAPVEEWRQKYRDREASHADLINAARRVTNTREQLARYEAELLAAIVDATDCGVDQDAINTAERVAQ